MNNLDFLTTLTKHLLRNGLDYEVTLEGSGTTVKLLDDMTGSTIATSKQETLEEALAATLASAATRVTGEQRLSIL